MAINKQPVVCVQFVCTPIPIVLRISQSNVQFLFLVLTPHSNLKHHWYINHAQTIINLICTYTAAKFAEVLPISWTVIFSEKNSTCTCVSCLKNETGDFESISLQLLNFILFILIMNCPRSSLPRYWQHHICFILQYIKKCQ